MGHWSCSYIVLHNALLLLLLMIYPHLLLVHQSPVYSLNLHFLLNLNLPSVCCLLSFSILFNALLCILISSILFTFPNHCKHFLFIVSFYDLTLSLSKISCFLLLLSKISSLSSAVYSDFSSPMCLTYMLKLIDYTLHLVLS